jgi:sugar phosphate isomerase/epimerase
MKIGITSIGFLGYDMTRVVPFLKDLGFDGLELIYYPESWADHVPSPEALRKVCREQGLELCSLRFIAGDAAEPLEPMELAAFFGVPLVDVKIDSVDQGAASDRDFRDAASRLASVADSAARLGMGVVLETHPGVVHASCAAALRLLDLAGRGNTAVNYDQANLAYAGKEDADTALSILEGRIGFVHLKNGWFPDGSPVWTPLKYGRIDYRRIIGALRSGGYQGYLTVEKPSGGEPFAWAEEDFVYVKSLLEPAVAP